MIPAISAKRIFRIKGGSSDAIWAEYFTFDFSTNTLRQDNSYPAQYAPWTIQAWE